MQFPDSTYAALNIASDEPRGFVSLLALAILLTLAAVAIGLAVANV